MTEPAKVGRTMKAAHQIKLASQDEMAMAIELIDVHTPRSQELSLMARRCLLLMLEAAAGDAWKPQPHQILKRDLRGSHRSMDRVRPAIEELMQVWFSHADLLGGKPSTLMFHLLESINEQDTNDPSAYIHFHFTEHARKILQRSEVYARLSRAAIINFKSSYALRMYEIGAALYSKRDPSWSGDQNEVRTLLQVPKGTYPNFSDLRKRVLQPAKEEIDQLAEFTFDWDEFTKGRKVDRIRLNFTPKAADKALAAAEENERHSAGRAPRRDDTVERIVDVANLVATAAKSLRSDTNDARWPNDDQLADYYDPHGLYKVAREYGGGHAVSRLAKAYAEHMGEKRFQLTGQRLLSSWKGYVISKAESWQRP